MSRLSVKLTNTLGSILSTIRESQATTLYISL